MYYVAPKPSENLNRGQFFSRLCFNLFFNSLFDTDYPHKISLMCNKFVKRNVHTIILLRKSTHQIAIGSLFTSKCKTFLKRINDADEIFLKMYCPNYSGLLVGYFDSVNAILRNKNLRRVHIYMLDTIYSHYIIIIMAHLCTCTKIWHTN